MTFVIVKSKGVEICVLIFNMKIIPRKFNQRQIVNEIHIRMCDCFEKGWVVGTGKENKIISEQIKWKHLRGKIKRLGEKSKDLDTIQHSDSNNKASPN